MISFRDLVSGFRSVGLAPGRPVVVHAALSAFGDEIRGGPESVLGALLSVTLRVMAPSFTYKTMLIPETGPEENACDYGSGADQNRMAEFFSPEMPADKSMGALAEALRRHPLARRSTHPILSFSGIGLDSALGSQSFDEPFAPLRILAEMGGEVLLIGVDQRANTSIHYAERLAGRKQFVRWALTAGGVAECPHFPGCSEGFNQLAPYLDEITRRARVGKAEIRAISMAQMLKKSVDLIRVEPVALLCGREDCERCEAVRGSTSMQPD
jgi:aminoglycoside 3-N-acetyltransferase